MTTQSTPIKEQLFLKQNALLSIFTGTLFLFGPIYSLFKGHITHNSALFSVLSVVSIIFLVGTLITLIKMLSSIKGIKSTNFWYSDFEDEYFNHINTKGFKYSWSTLATILIVLLILSDEVISPLISLNDLASAMIGLMMLSYGLTVAWFLRADDE